MKFLAKIGLVLLVPAAVSFAGAEGLKNLTRADIFASGAGVPAAASRPVAKPASNKFSFDPSDLYSWFFYYVPPKPLPVKEWTVMVYANGKNNLELAGLYNINEMEKIGSTDGLNIVVEQGRMSGQEGDTKLDFNWTGSKRYYITKDKDERHTTSIVYQRKQAVDMGDYKEVVDFINWTKTYFPAKRYMLVLWDHGSGWRDPKKFKPQAISWDDETGNFVATVDIGTILKDTGKVDVLAFDACLMQMAEVAYEVKDYAEVMVGSEETIPGLGYNYAGFLSALAANPAMSAEALSRAIVDSFNDFYIARKVGSTQLSAIRLAALPGLSARLDNFTEAVVLAKEVRPLQRARYGTFRFQSSGKPSRRSYADLYDFAQKLSFLSSDQRTHQTATELMRYIDGTLVITTKATGDSYNKYTHGLAIELARVTGEPPSAVDANFGNRYSDLAFSKVCKWGEFIEWLGTISSGLGSDEILMLELQDIFSDLRDTKK